MSINVSLIQMNVTFGNPKENQERISSYFSQVNFNTTDIVVLPELWTTGYDLKRLDEIADNNANDTIYFISKLAKANNVNIIAGSIAKRTGSKVTNTMIIFNRKGEVVKHYDKAHLFRLMEEDKYLTGGSLDGVFELDNTKCAGVICYDIRFPEWIRTNMLHNTKVLFVVAEWPRQRIDHWRALLISRAIENQSYVVACNRVGSDPNNQFGGHSMIIDPWGEVVEEALEEEIVIHGVINPDLVEEVRNTIPIDSDRRPDIYQLYRTK
ncbi:carbon-nitrogen family hydrolase [Aquibacillus kalidii]|uniref:carbon-nitrogen family hydrolase n=1 Tax=Aquibacillus kalidii TaxID=2762597 RepID=UPI0016444B87|nr:carbon-nitrogen family hydrolase [Aquibacillus kalidii]